MPVETDFSGVDKKARILSAALQDFRPVLTEIRADSHAEIFKQLNLGGKPKFKKLTTKYNRYKQKKFGNKPILTATGRMRIEYARSGSVTEKEFVLIPPNVVAASHQANDRTRLRKLPRRAINLSNVLKKSIGIIGKAIEKKLRESGFRK